MVDLKRWSLEIVGKAGNWTESAGEALLENADNLMDKAGNWTETRGGALLDNAGNWTKSAGGAFLENTGELINKAGNWTEATGGVILDNAGNFMEKAGNWTESTGGAIVENAEDLIGKTGNWTEYVGDSFNEPELWPSDDKFFYMLIWVLLCGLIGIIGFPLSMIAIGFTVDGVTALSCAAITQGYVYGGATSGCFSILQALGTNPLAMIPIGFVFGSIVGGLIANSIYDNHFDIPVSTTATITLT